MSAFPDETLKGHQHEVQRLLGQCMLNLQVYERQIKRIVAVCEIPMTAHSLETTIADRTSGNAKKTLGNLVGEILGSFVISDKASEHPEPKDTPADAPPSMGMNFQVAFPDEDYVKIESDLKEFVSFRNDLVHHFIDQHDIWSVAGCRVAKDALDAARSRIKQHLEQLREWAEDIDNMRESLAGVLGLDLVKDLIVNGIAPDGAVDWSRAGIVTALREAATALVVDGWATIEEAVVWIAERHPEQRPDKYGCRSWRQVVQESGQFDLKYFELNGVRAACYRKKECTENS